MASAPVKVPLMSMAVDPNNPRERKVCAPMADGDSPFPPNKSGQHPNSRANLRPRKPGDPPLNPDPRNNGRRRAEFVAAWLELEDETPAGKKLTLAVGCPEGTSRIVALLQRTWLAAMAKSESSRKELLQQYAGKPKVQVDLSNDDGSLAPRSDTLADKLRAIIDEEQRAAEGDGDPEK